MLTQVLLEDERRNFAFTASDRVFLGEGLFETLKVEQGKPLYADLHWQRLRHSAVQAGILFDLPYEHWLNHLLMKLYQDKLQHGGIKAILSSGSAPRGLTEYGQGSWLMLQTFSLTPHTSPIRLMRAPWLRDAANPIYQIKSINYLEAILARRQAQRAGADDALFFNGRNHATETTSANLFLIQKQFLLTPPITDGLLPGITRNRVLALAKQHHIPCEERSLTYAMLAEAEALFLTNSLQGVRAVCALDDRNYRVSHPLLEHLKSSLQK